MEINWGSVAIGVILSTLVSTTLIIGLISTLPAISDSLRGPQGLKGDTGSQGIKGDTGLQGPKGDSGPQGPKGDQGLLGPQGLQGKTGFYSVYSAVGSSVDIPGIVNGDFSQNVPGGGKTGWLFQGTGGSWYDSMMLIQKPDYSTFMSQTIIVGGSQGVAFRAKGDRVRMEVQLDGYVIFYGDMRDGVDWTRIEVPFGDLYTGTRTLYIRVLPGPDDGGSLTVDDVTLIQFS